MLGSLLEMGFSWSVGFVFITIFDLDVTQVPTQPGNSDPNPKDLGSALSNEKSPSLRGGTKHAFENLTPPIG